MPQTKERMHSVPPHAKALLGALNFSAARKDSLDTLTESEWKDILSHWAWVRLTLPLRLVCGDDLPSWVCAQIDENIAENTQRFERVKNAYLEIAGVLHDAGVEYLVLKGFAQWPAYMQGPRLRTQTDIDLFCPPESVFRGRDAFRALGYRWHDVLGARILDHLPALAKESHWQWRGKHFDPDMPVGLELHFRFWNEAYTRLKPVGLEQFWSRRVARQLDGFTYPVLDEVDCLAYSALHVLRSLFYGGLQFYNVYEIAWFLHTNADDAAFWEKRRELHHESLRALEAVCFRLAKEWFGCRLPEELEREIESLPTGVQHWFQKYRDSSLTAPIRPNKNVLWLHLSLLESSSDKRSILWSWLLPMPAESTKHWTPQAYGKYLVHATSRGLYHLRILPKMLWDGVQWWWSTNDLGKPFWTLFAASSCYDIGLFIFYFLYNLYLLDRGYTEKFLGQVTSANALGGIAGTIPAGILAQRFGLRRSMVACLSLLTLFSVLLALLVSRLPQLCLAFLASAASTAWSVYTLPAMAQVTTERNRPLGFSLMMSSGIGLGVVAGVVGGSLPSWLARIDTRASAGNLKEGALLIASGIVALALWPASRMRFAPAPAPEKRFYPRGPFVYRYLVAMMVWSLVTSAFSPFFNAYFSQYWRMPLKQIGLVSSASQLATVVAILAAPVIFRRLGMVAGIMYSQLATAGLLLGLASTSATKAAGVVYVIFTAVLWMSEPGMFSLLMDRVTPSERSGASALTLLVITLANSIAAILAGASFARYGYPAVLRVTAAVAVVAALLLRFLLGKAAGQTSAVPQSMSGSVSHA